MGKTAISILLKDKRKQKRLTQPMLAKKTGVGLHFIRDLEQGKKTVCLEKLNQVIAYFGYVMHPVRQTSQLPYRGPVKKIKLSEIDDPEWLPGEF